MASKRNRKKHTLSFDQRLQRAAIVARRAAGLLPEGRERETLLEKARQAETASHINEWLAPPSLSPSSLPYPSGLRSQSSGASIRKTAGTHRGADEIAIQRPRE